uniref:Uncharacterized protein n=1 Tax=Plectus sambesii TaxID=2011161 RepID=A0A914XL68_9BILA
MTDGNEQESDETGVGANGSPVRLEGALLPPVDCWPPIDAQRWLQLLVLLARPLYYVRPRPPTTAGCEATNQWFLLKARSICLACNAKITQALTRRPANLRLFKNYAKMSEVARRLTDK